jgi:sigma-B regulation protein RsbU (phosphoserine phosphatase)
MSKPTHTAPVDWTVELNETAFKYHVLTAWVAIVLNPLWSVGDYYNSRAHFTDFLIFRLVVTVATLVIVLYKNRFTNKPEIIALVPVLGISIQNAYMYSVMDIGEFQKQTFAYIALYIGAGMFVLWKTRYTITIVILSFIANVLFFSANSKLQLSDILTNGGLLTATVAIFTVLLIYKRTHLTQNEIKARLALAKSNNELEIKNEIIEEKNKDIKDSINYAQRIQLAILPPVEKINKELKDYFIFYQPKDIVSGDFYWQASVHTTPANGEPQEVVVMAAVDCTGHGVPGALMSIIGSTILNQTVTNRDINSPADVLNYLNKEIIKSLSTIKDGMDIAFCAINRSALELQYAGANNPLYIVRNKQLIEIKADKQAIGADNENAEIKTFTNHIFQLEKGDAVYLFTDGYADQFGGPKGKKFKYKKFQELLIEIHEHTMEEQKSLLKLHHEQWKGSLEQVDDILVIGIRI